MGCACVVWHVMCGVRMCGVLMCGISLFAMPCLSPSHSKVMWHVHVGCRESGVCLRCLRPSQSTTCCAMSMTRYAISAILSRLTSCTDTMLPTSTFSLTQKWTASAIYTLERGGFRTTVSDAVWAAYRRSLELGGG
jgi:hypothetical protein